MPAHAATAPTSSTAPAAPAAPPGAGTASPADPGWAAGAAVGAVLADRYRLQRLVAVGGMGQVWQAADAVLGRTVAVKLLKPELASDPSFVSRFRAEARAAAALNHPGVAAVHDYGELPGVAAGLAVPFLVMEFVPGEPLSALLAGGVPLGVAATLDLVAQVGAALQAAHDVGVVHRDVKPGNLLVRPDGLISVTDFGIARAAGAVPLTATGTVLGTAYYLSPEAASGGHVTGQSDVYALGAVAYECLAGRRPFPGDNPVAVALAQVRDAVPPLPAEVPPAAAALVLAALAKDPAARPAGAAELASQAAAVRTVLYGPPAPAVAARIAAVTAATGHPMDPGRAEGGPAAGGLAAGGLAAAGLAAGALAAGGRAAGGFAADGSAMDSGAGATRVLPGGWPAPPPRGAAPDSATTVLPAGHLAGRPAGAGRPRRVRWPLLGLAVLLLLVVGLRGCGGVARERVPATGGLQPAAAVRLVTAAHLHATQRPMDSATVPAGTVIGTQPAAGSRVRRGSAVTLLVSDGPPVVPLSLASLAGQPVGAAVARLTAAHLHATTQVSATTAAPAGTVILATAGSAPLRQGDTVTLVVAVAPPAVTYGQGNGRGRGDGGGGGDGGG